MWGNNHKKITREALNYAAPNLNETALEFISEANVDSDSHMGRYAPQHFQEKWRPSITFFNRTIKGAIRFAYSKEDFTSAFYFLGRAFHNLQDFYAHTNWVFYNWKADKLWNGKIDHNIKLSTMTPWDRQVDNLHNFRRLERWSKKSSQKYFEKIRTQSLPHPDMQLDVEDSFASKLYRDEKKGNSGYEQARRFARAHTAMYWITFINDVKKYASKKNKNQKKLLGMIYNHKPNMGELKKCRYKFVTNLHRSYLALKF